MTPSERFWSKVQKTDSCWLWLGGASSKGYGVFWTGLSHAQAHRWAYEATVGPIPAGLTIDHVAKRGCRSKRCVNPAHLEPVTSGVNTRRAAEARAPAIACPKGHPFTPENTRVEGRNRRCRTCLNDRRRRAHRAGVAP